MSCPACGQAVAAGLERCPACQAVVSPPNEGALAPEPRPVTPSSRGRAEPLRELPGVRRRERTWKDEVRERVRDRKRQRAGDAELPLFRDPGPLDDLVSSDPPAAEAVPARAAASVPLGIHELGDETGPPVDADDLPLRPQEPDAGDAFGEPAVGPLDRSRASAGAAVPEPGRMLLDEPAPRPPHDREPERRLEYLSDGAEAGRAEPLGDGRPREEGREWTLDAPAAAALAAPTDRPADWFDRLQAGAVDLALLAGLWTVVVYFASRAAHVPVAGLLPAWPYLAAYLVFLGLVYAAYFTGATGQTLGKIVSGLRVVDAAGQPPGYLRAFLRAAVGAAGIALLFGGLVPMFLDPARRALHDRLLRTRVVKG